MLTSLPTVTALSEKTLEPADTSPTALPSARARRARSGRGGGGGGGVLRKACKGFSPRYGVPVLGDNLVPARPLFLRRRYLGPRTCPLLSRFSRRLSEERCQVAPRACATGVCSVQVPQLKRTS